MDKEILKLLPQKAFKLLSIKETLRIAATVAKSIIDKKSYSQHFEQRLENWKWTDISLSSAPVKKENSKLSKSSGEKILKVYFSQFFEKNLAVHLDLRSHSFVNGPEIFIWIPSKLHYCFSLKFIEGVQQLYIGFYLNDEKKFIEGLYDLQMIKKSMSEVQKSKIQNLFYKHFEEAKSGPVKFSMKNLQTSFNNIFSFFLQEDIPLNPEFALLGVNLVTLYLTLEQISGPIDVHEIFLQVYKNYEL
jgi:predicted unusual protein kinase regulating ubiquinone biosynthesis (AarF/ABC1/UbiB family)